MVLVGFRWFQGVLGGCMLVSDGIKVIRDRFRWL